MMGLGSGSALISSQVAAANGIVNNYLGVMMAQIIKQVKLLSRYVLQTEKGHIL